MTFLYKIIFMKIIFLNIFYLRIYFDKDNFKNLSYLKFLFTSAHSRIILHLA
jgi:hypothetical protein